MTLDGLNAARTSAVYQVSVSPAQASISVKAAIQGLTADMDLALVKDLNNNGIAENNEILKSSITAGTIDETLNLFNLTTGTYYLVVKLADGRVSSGNYTLQMGMTTEIQQDLLWRNATTGELGAWTFNGTTYQGSQSITKQFGTDWTIESGVLDDKGFADFNGDRTSDVVLRKSTGEVKLLLLENNIVIDSPTLGTVGAQDVLLGMADFNRDGLTDLLWRNTGTNAVTLWQVNQSLAGFATVNLTGLASPNQYEFQGLADFNGDGNVDILWRTKPDAQSNYRLRMTLLNGTNLVPNGDSGPILESLPTNWKVISLLDQNGDGKADLWFQWMGTPLKDNLSVWTMNGAVRLAGTYQDRPFIQDGVSLSGSYGSGTLNDRKTITAWRDRGTGTLMLRSMDNKGGESIQWIQESETKDLNRVSQQMLQRTLTERVIPQNLSGTQTDVVWRSQIDAQNTQLGYWRFNGTEYLGSTTIGGTIDSRWSVETTGDFDGNGVEDFIWYDKVDHSYAIWYMSQGAGPVGAFLTAGGMPIKLSKQDWTIVGAQDIDIDGKAELLWQNKDLSSIVYWKLGATVTDFKVPVTGFFLNPLTPNPWKVSGVGDFDGDGAIDLLLRDVTLGNTAFVSIRNQQRTPIVSHSFKGIFADWVVEGVGDFDGDRKADLLWRNTNTGKLVMWRMPALSTVEGQDWGGFNIAQTWQVVGVEDFDGDGKADILWRNVDTTSALRGELSLWRTQSPAPGQFNNPLRQAIHLKGSEFLNPNIIDVKTVGRSIAIPAAATTIQINLVNDTGTIGDNVTNSPDFKISVGDSGAIAELIISLDGTNWQNVKSQLVNNTVTIDRTKLEALLGKSLEDGSYTVSVRSKDNVGKITNQSLSFDLDNTAPTLDVSGVFNGINWLPSDQVKAQLTDRGSGLLNVTYQVDNQGPIAWTGSNGNWLKSVSELLSWNDSQQQGSNKLTIRGADRAGNEQNQTIDFAVAKPLTWIDTDVWSDVPLNSSNPNLNDSFTGSPAGSGSGGGSAVYGWGANGYWGYSSGGSWYASPYNTPQDVMSHPQWFPSNPNPTDVSTYRQRLTKILTTAIAAIPGTTDTNKAKKASLKNRMAVLIESGVIIHGDSSESTSWGYEGGYFPGDSYWNDRFFLGSLEKASHSNISTVSLGLALAKNIMNGTDSVRLQTFETLVETVIGAAHLDTNWFGSGKMVEIQRSAREIARMYGLLKPQGTALTGAFAWLDQLWDLTESPNLSGTAIRSILFDKYDRTKGIVGKVIQMMNELGDDRGDRDDAQLLGMAEGLLRSALQVDALKSDLQSVEVVQELLQLGYEIIKVKPTTSVDNSTEVSTWIETILEKGDDRTSAAGLSEFIGGSKTKDDRLKTLQFSGRLMRAAEGVLDWRAKLQIQRSDTLSELVNLGGAYAALNPNEGKPLDADPNKMF